ncbi:ester cyclase [Phytoactinopolyspora halotolerans]|uniref:Ester cyclase n=1 Tax=Phytoactinopolyspora halotolerans TaxID=1981512 RepID=A0A6L9S5Z8_9ACTN|nr:ester cyclase [Phytoactinopolyspora halotolerans]NED99937.1 ester cyclase [Phytoactinopolyspora halotolerans]
MSDNKERVRRLWEQVWPNGDVAGLSELIHADGVNHAAPPGAPQGFEGAKQTMFWLRSAFSDERYEIHQLVEEGDTVVAFMTHHGRHTGEFMGIEPTGREFAYQHVHIHRLEDGKVIEHWLVRDDATFMQQIGVAGPGAATPAPR